MTKTPFDQLLDEGVEWTPTGNKATPGSELPYATHSGVLTVMGHQFKCFRLNTGEAVFDAEDVRAFFDGAIG